MTDEIGSRRTLPLDDLPCRCAEAALRVMPSFNRWATARVERDRLGGELSLRQLTVLYLIREETPTLGYIARRLMVTPAVVTGIVDRLEKRGYVQRRADAEDRRVVRLALTESGRAESLAVQDQLVEAIAARLAAYPVEEVAELGRGLALLEQVLQDLDRANGHPVGARVAFDLAAK
jgi:DNA-binding MarR family transcriptional regulator